MGSTIDYAALPAELWHDVLLDFGLTPEEIDAIALTTRDTGSQLNVFEYDGIGYYHESDIYNGCGIHGQEGEGRHLLWEDSPNLFGVFAFGNGWVNNHA